MESNIGKDAYARSNSKIEIKREIIVIHAIHYSNRNNGSKTKLCTGFNGNSQVGATTNGYIELCLLDVELSHFVVCSSINREVSIEQIKSKVANQIEIIHAILHANTRVGAEV